MYVRSVLEEKLEVRMLKSGTEYMNREMVAEANEDMLFADGLDDALVGYIERAGMPSIACYDKDKCIEILAKDMTYEEAIEYFYFNTAGAYVGENTPCFLTRTEDEN
jgi:capsule polysaccharide modification protein KpsS